MRKILSIFIGVIVIIFVITYFTGYSLVFDFNTRNINNNIICSNGTVSPFKNFDFNSDDNWKMYIVLKNRDTLELPENIEKANYLSTSDIDLLNNIKNNWNFNCTDGDMATVESKVVLLKNNEIVFESGIVINNTTQGLQSKNFGWVKSNKLSEDLKKFKRSYSPIIFL
ncbi:hypothetical protein [Tenacibaculum sp. 190524A02b]|uniref:hypothetical protein n=1 Tax=Tenacibaculum vairaonense TaxID=3137860 RepID=UPI0031FB5A8A